MPKSYVQLMKQIDALRQQADNLKRKEVEGVVLRIKQAIAVYGLTAADLGLSASATGSRRQSAGHKRKGSALASAGKSGQTQGKPKFRDDAGHSWSGKGPRPGWFKAALASGKTIEDLLV